MFKNKIIVNEGERERGLMKRVVSNLRAPPSEWTLISSEPWAPLGLSLSFWPPARTSGGLQDHRPQSRIPGPGLGHSAGPALRLPWVQLHSSTTEHSRLPL